MRNHEFGCPCFGCQIMRAMKRKEVEAKHKADAEVDAMIAAAIREATREQPPVWMEVHTCPACLGKGVVRVVEGD